VREIDVKQLAAQLDRGGVRGDAPPATPARACYLLDVRQPWENQLAALPGSKLIPLNQLVTRFREIECPAGVPLVAYCHHGIRSQSAAEILENLGFTDVYSLAGGIDSWSVEVDPRVPRY
jgi:rhodanese-related sulfurtransferase